MRRRRIPRASRRPALRIAVRVALFVILSLGTSTRAATPSWPLPQGGTDGRRAVEGEGLRETPTEQWRLWLGGRAPTTWAADVNDDGITELVMLVGGRALCRRVTDGALLWATPPLKLGHFLPRDAAGQAPDLDGDGDPELVVSKASVGHTRIHVLDGATGERLWTFGEGLGPDSGVTGGNRARIRDLDADGGPELLLYVPRNANGARMWAFDFEGGFDGDPLAWETPWSGYNGAITPSLVDVTGSGSAEVLLNVADTLHVLRAEDGARLAEIPSWYGADADETHGAAPRAVEVDGTAGRELLFHDADASGGFVGVWDWRTEDATTERLWRRSRDGPMRVAAPTDPDADGRHEVVLAGWSGAGDGGGAWRTRVLEGSSGETRALHEGWTLTGVRVDVGGEGGAVPAIRRAESSEPETFGAVQLLGGEAGSLGLRRWAEPLAGAHASAAVDRDGDGAEELLVQRDEDGDGRGDALQIVAGASGTVRATHPYPKQLPRSFELAAADLLPPSRGEQVLVSSAEGFLDVLGPDLNPVGERLRGGNHTPTVLAARPTPEASMRLWAVDAAGRLLRIDPTTGGPTEPPERRVLRGAGRTDHLLGVVDPEGDGRREVFVHDRRDGQHRYVLLDAATGEAQWGWAPEDATHGPILDGVGAGGDLDGDGVGDLYVATRLDGEKVGVPLSGADGTPLGWRWTPYQPGSGGLGYMRAAPLFVDLDGQAPRDLLVSRYGDRRNGSVGSGEPGPPASVHGLRGTDGAVLTTASPTTKPLVHARAEIDGDPATVDVLAGWWRGRGALSVEPGEEASLEVRWTRTPPSQEMTKGRPVVVDLDGDGLDDLLHHDHGSGRVRALRGKDGQRLWPAEDSTERAGVRRLAKGRAWRVLQDGGYRNPATGTTRGSLPATPLAERAVGVAAPSDEASPLAVFAGRDGWIYALDGRTGELAWSWRVGFPVGALSVADTDGDGRVELLATAEDGYLRVLGGGPDVGQVPVVRDGASGADVDVVETPGGGLGGDRFAATWEPAEGGGTPDGYLVRLRTASGAVVVGWRDVGATTSAVVQQGVTLVPEVRYRVEVRPYEATGAGRVTASDGFRLTPEAAAPRLDRDGGVVAREPDPRVRPGQHEPSGRAVDAEPPRDGGCRGGPGAPTGWIAGLLALLLGLGRAQSEPSRRLRTRAAASSRPDAS